MARIREKKAIIAEYLSKRAQSMNRARVRALSPSRRKAIARKAAAIRWGKKAPHAL